MIVEMKKVTLLCMEQDRDRTLQALRKLGLLHVTPVQEPGGDDLSRQQQLRELAAQASSILAPYADKEIGAISADSHVETHAATIIETIHGLIEENKQLDDQKDRLLRAEKDCEPYGDFSPESIQELAKHGITVRLYRVPKKQTFVEPEGVMVQPLGEDANGRRIAVIGQGDFEVDAEEFALPEQSLAEIRAELKDLSARHEKIEEELTKLSAQLPQVEAHVANLDEHIQLLETRGGMGEAPQITYIEGYCPEPRLKDLHDALAENGWGLTVSDPDPEVNVPTLIKYPRWVQPVKSILDILGILPGYDEVDVSAAFLVFFSLFFGMLVGDAGYGLIFLALAFIMRWKIKTFPARAFALLVITSTSTVVWGALSGTWFGITNLPAPLRSITIPWLSSETNVMALCFLIGAIHLTLAHGWALWRLRRKLQALAQVGWIISTWMMYFLARWLVLGYDKPDFVWPLVGVAAAFIALFMTPPKKLKTEWFGHAMLPLDMISNFVDVVSYVRLFAVGAASLAVAAAFNEMALSKGISGPISAIIAAAILFMGHALNLVMAIMGVMVHGIRLNTLEFSGHIGVEWRGYAYRPFARQEAKTD